jgi:hypothetical protein
MVKKNSEKLKITNDVYLSLDGASYGEPYRAIEDALDNCLIGINDERLSENHVRKISIDFFCGDSSIPNNIRITDNGIGMSVDTLRTKLFVTTAVDAITKAELGGTSRWGLGYKQFCIYLGTPGEVWTREVGLDDEWGIQALCEYHLGDVPNMTHSLISEEPFKHATGGNVHGTAISVIDLKQEKWTASWWNPKGNTWFKSFQCRYNRLLSTGKLEITLNKHTGKGLTQRILNAASFLLDNGTEDSLAYTDYQNCTRNNWTVKGQDLEISKLDITVKVNMGKHLSAARGDEWKTIGDMNLIAQSASKSANPGIYVYQNNILIAVFKYKGSDRDGGLSHLNNLFVEVDVPNDVVIPTNTTKNNVDEVWMGKIAKGVRVLAETKWIPQDVNELAWHKAFQTKALHEMDGAGIRSFMFDGISHTELEDQLYHEFPKGASRPDFKWENGELKAIMEFKDEKATDEACKQMAKYVMDTNFEADVYYLIAPSFNDSVKNTFKNWNKLFEQCKFELITFDKIGLKLNS